MAVQIILRKLNGTAMLVSEIQFKMPFTAVTQTVEMTCNLVSYDFTEQGPSNVLLQRSRGAGAIQVRRAHTWKGGLSPPERLHPVVTMATAK